MKIYCYAIWHSPVIFNVLMAALTIQQIKALHLYDCLRANKSTSAWGVEARVPFLDKEFINTAMSIDPEWKMVWEFSYIVLHFILWPLAV